MGFRNPVTSLRADQITPGTFGPGVIGRELATADAGRRVVISADPGSAGTIDFWGDPDGPGQPEGHASITVLPVGGVSGDATLEITASDAIARLRAEEIAGGGVRSVIDLAADVVNVGGLAWATYVPALSGITGTVNRARWIRVAGLVTVQVIITVATVPANIGIGLPVAAAAGAVNLTAPVGVATGHSGAATIMAPAFLRSATELRVRAPNTSEWGPGTPFAWAATHVFALTATYEPAA